MREYLLLYCLIILLIFPKDQFAQWTTVTDEGKYYILGIEFIDENTAFAGGYLIESNSGVIIRSTDGGDSWDEVYVGQPYFPGPRCFDFVNDTLGFSGGTDGLLFKTIDGGSTWEMFSNISGTININNILFFNESIGLARNKRTTDGGYTWEDTEIGNTYDFYQINDSSCFVAGGGIFLTIDCGESWLEVDSTSSYYKSVFMATDLVGYAVKNPDKIYKTIDGGMSWFILDSLGVDEIRQIRFTDENTGFILLNNESMRVMRTTDGGYSWDYVLFGNADCRQLAISTNETILVPTTNGIMYKTTNGGGDPILPRYPEIDWYSGLRFNTTGNPPLTCINSFSQVFLMGSFRDTLFVNETPIYSFPYPLGSALYILKFNSWGGLEWSKMIADPESKLYQKSYAINNNNDFYALYSSGDPLNVHLTKYSSVGDSLWTINFFLEFLTLTGGVSMKSTYEDHIVIYGKFSGTLSYGNNSIHTENWGLFMLELDQNGNFVNLNRIVETIYPSKFSDLNFDINDEGSNCISFRCYGPAYIDADTLDSSLYYILNLDQNLNMLWYNTEFDTTDKTISSISFFSNSNLLVGGNDIINDKKYSVVYQYNEQGIKIDSAIINSGADFYSSPDIDIICKTTNNRILVSGSYQDYSIFNNDTLYAFDQYVNQSIYTLSDHLEYVKSSHISSAAIYDIHENQHNSYFLGKEYSGDVFFANDTIPEDKYNYFLAKLNSIITPVFESKSYNMASVYPNPGTGIFHVSIPEGITKNGYFEIFSITGQKVFESKFSERNNTINLSNLEKGIYFIQINLQGTIYSQKIIIQ